VLVVRTRFAHREALLPLVLAGAVVIGENTRDPAIALLGGDGEPLGEPVSQEADAILQQLDNAGTLSPGESV
jgi:hypothetical protein